MSGGSSPRDPDPGSAATALWSWAGPTAPFLDAHGNQPARFVLRQVGDSDFEVVEGFRLTRPGAEPVVVDHSTLVETDLASIPAFMAWFVPINGRHTPAALVHDQLVRAATAVGSPADRAAADRVFLEAMADCDVPLVRRNVMYTAVTLATRWTTGGWVRAGIALWALALLAGTTALVWAAFTGAPLLALLAVLAPVPGGLLWGARNRGQGVLAGYTVWVVALPALATLVGYRVYWVCEEVARWLLAARRDVSRDELPPPAGLR